MALGSSRKFSALLICSIFLLQLVLISDNVLPVKANRRRILMKLKTIGALLFLLKHKKPKIGVLPIPLPLPIPLKIEAPKHPVVVHKSHPEPYAVAEPIAEGYGDLY